MLNELDQIDAESDSDEVVSSDSPVSDIFDDIVTDSEDEDKGPGDGDAGAGGDTGIGVH